MAGIFPPGLSDQHILGLLEMQRQLQQSPYDPNYQMSPQYQQLYNQGATNFPTGVAGTSYMFPLINDENSVWHWMDPRTGQIAQPQKNQEQPKPKRKSQGT